MIRWPMEPPRTDGSDRQDERSPADTIEPPAFVLESDDLSLAFFVAGRAHAGHTRGDHGRPYLQHPIEVAELLQADGNDEVTIAAGLLHDVVEDSVITIGEVFEIFGIRIGELVAALTEDPGIEDWEDRKAALRASAAEGGPEAVAIYVADKLANLRDWSAVYGELGEETIEHFKAPTIDARIRAWRADLGMAEQVAPELSMNDRLGSRLSEFVHRREQSVSRDLASSGRSD
jgi:(p)ppGpp synthase/HD superfamily hydrolase